MCCNTRNLLVLESKQPITLDTSSVIAFESKHTAFSTPTLEPGSCVIDSVIASIAVMHELTTGIYEKGSSYD